jgi:hypothetical protein
MVLHGPTEFGFSPCLCLDSISVDDSRRIRTGTGTVGDIDRQVYHISFDLFYNNAKIPYFLDKISVQNQQTIVSFL